MTTILAAIDDSAAAHPVLATALALAPILDARVLAVHVADADIQGGTASETAESMNVTLRRVGGDPFEQIRQMANDDEVVAVVLGARARPTGRRPAGHLALALAGAITRPLVIVPPDAQPPRRIARVLIAMKGTPRSARELVQIIQLGAAAELDLVVVHVDDEDTIPAFSDQAQYDTQDYANEFLTRYCKGAPEARLVLRVGLPVDEILATADEVDPDMLAIGWAHGLDPDRARVAREIVARSHVPVLVAAIKDPAT
jgi:nucleotide-binding universal stress UspA family protein